MTYEYLTEDDFQKMMHVPVYRGGNGIGKKKPRVIRSPVDFVKGKGARARYTGVTKECNTYNMFDKDHLLPLEEIEALPFEEAQKYLEKARDFYTNKELIEHFGISQYNFYVHVLKKYGLVKGPKTATNSKRQNSTGQAQEKSVTIKKQVNPKNFNISMEGDYTGDEVAMKILKLADLLAEDGSYSIVISITEN